MGGGLRRRFANPGLKGPETSPLPEGERVLGVRLDLLHEEAGALDDRRGCGGWGGAGDELDVRREVLQVDAELRA